MSELLYIPIWKTPTVSEEWKGEQLKAWKDGCLSDWQVKSDLKFYQTRKKQDAQRLDNLKRYAAEQPFHSEWMDVRIVRLEAEIMYWDENINFLKWLLEQTKKK